MTWSIVAAMILATAEELLLRPDAFAYTMQMKKLIIDDF